ncbi:DUF4267 domain-containing protein [Solihabitans fulvus]|uniref:DUF4267 domain-containing protein n=1 Tax=Solihabitans fulvus TaxID=1892852 RepID=A0A5B2XTV4_9PSEU|nr:DUF4267 domain-containing protein [Solihabitans fulvus]KAA2267107.1 DUF4267 domain-containing protein [Solihabitans fulvus]
MSGTKVPSRATIGTVLAVLGALFIIYVGANYLLLPETTASSFGLPSWPHGQGDGFLALKGIRDVVSGLTILVIVVVGNRRVLGWIMLAQAVTPIGDMTTVLSSGGSTATAFGVHGATAAVIAFTALLLLSGSRVRSPQPVA